MKTDFLTVKVSKRDAGNLLIVIHSQILQNMKKSERINVKGDFWSQISFFKLKLNAQKTDAAIRNAPLSVDQRVVWAAERIQNLKIFWLARIEQKAVHLNVLNEIN